MEFIVGKNTNSYLSNSLTMASVLIDFGMFQGQEVLKSLKESEQEQIMTYFGKSIFAKGVSA